MGGAVRVPEQSRQCNPLAHKTAHPCHFKECAVLTRINPVISFHEGRLGTGNQPRTSHSER